MMAERENDQIAADFVDTFSGELACGKVVNSINQQGVRRGGIDTENVIGIDNGALRITPLIVPGWGRAVLSYPACKRENGLIFAVMLLNGHNASQADSLSDLFGDRLWRWANGSGDGWKNLVKRGFYWLTRGYKSVVFRKLRWWYHIRKEGDFQPNIEENMALGWFATEIEPDPLTGDGHRFVMHGGGANNGDLWVGVDRRFVSVIPSAQNIPLCYVVILREQGAAYYLATLANVPDITAFPALRPLAIDPTGSTPNLYPAIQQSVLGQIGFRVDSRVYTTQVAHSQMLSKWYGTAHAADRLCGSSPLDESSSETNLTWTIINGTFARTEAGASTNTESMAVLIAAAPSGLVNSLILNSAGVIWRFQDRDHYWLAAISEGQFRVEVTLAGESHVLHQGLVATPETPAALQVSDNGEIIQIAYAGQLLWRGCDDRLEGACGIGIYASSSRSLIRDFEAHPRTVTIPELQLKIPSVRHAAQTIVLDDFSGDRGDFEGSRTTIGNKTWQRVIGSGVFERTGEGGVQVRASVERPNWERTAYTIGWDDPNYAELDVTIHPPGQVRNQGHRCRGGFIFWQDKLNFIIINTWWNDYDEIASISSFFTVRGVEDIYDAVWTNVGNRLRWGEVFRLRVSCDGAHYLASINDEPVLYRALTDIYPRYPRLNIHRVGLVANWEWGDDTGSTFSQFVAKV